MNKTAILASLIFSVFTYSQTFIQAYQDRADQVSQNNINTYLQEFENLGVKKTGTTANANALSWLKNKYLSFGYTSDQIVEYPWTRSGYTSKNLIITKTGTLYPDKYVIICGHFDSIVGPGTNDNGSGVSVILEIARILKDVPTEYSIRFINFSGEEQGLHGSYHYVQYAVNATNPKMDIKLVFNIDEVGGVAGETNNTIYCDRDESSPSSNNAASYQITQELANCTELYSPLETDFDPAYASDYVPFQQNGEVITGFYEHNISSYPHTAQDVLANMDPVYVYNVAKAAVGAAQHFAVA
ncbi:MAG: M28 family peptidase, partial [Bergeyella sp.]